MLFYLYEFSVLKTSKLFVQALILLIEKGVLTKTEYMKNHFVKAKQTNKGRMYK